MESSGTIGSAQLVESTTMNKCSLLKLVNVLNAMNNTVDAAIAATVEVTIDALTELRELSKEGIKSTISLVCEGKRSLRVFLPPAAAQTIEKLTDGDRLSTTPQPDLYWKDVLDIIELMPDLCEIHITGDGDALGGDLAQELRQRRRWTLRELTACCGDELSLTLLKHCDLAALECLRITCYGRRFRELQKPANGTKLNHLEIFYTASGIYETWEDGYVPGLDSQSQEVICDIFPNLDTLAMTHVERSPLVFEPQDLVDRYGYPQRFVEMCDGFDHVFSAIKVPSFPKLRRLAITIPRELTEWFCQNCDCFGAETFWTDKYGHLAQHIATWGENLWLLKLGGENDEDQATYFPEQRDENGRDKNGPERHQGDTDMPISQFVMFKTV